MADAGEARDFDVVVVGSGIAGLSAAVTVRRAGCRVAVLERSPPEDRGGNTRWTEAFLRLKSETAVADDFIAHFARHAGHHLDPEIVAETAGDFDSRSPISRALGFTDPDLIARFAEEAPGAVAWLKSFGVRFEFLPLYFITTSTTRLGTVGGGRAMVEALGAWADDNGVETFYRTTARSLIEDGAGAVTGVEAVGPGNKRLAFRAPSVVLASGGFEGNPEMLARYLGPNSRYIRPVARGGYYNRGEGLEMALAIGAAPAGDYTRFHAEPLDPRSGAPEPVVMIFNYGILIDVHGRRFTDEAPSSADATYEAVTRIIGEQPDGKAWLVLDARLDEIAGWTRCALRPTAVGGIDAGGAGGEDRRAGRRAERDRACLQCRLSGGLRLPAGAAGWNLYGGRIRAAQVQLGIPADTRAVPGLPDHLRQLLHIRRAEGRSRCARAQPGRRGDPGTVRGRRDDRPLLGNLYGRDERAERRCLRPHRRCRSRLPRPQLSSWAGDQRPANDSACRSRRPTCPCASSVSRNIPLDTRL
jgi:FAD binding domain